MAYYKITRNKKGELQAKIQVSAKNLSTGKTKIYPKRVYNTETLTEAKFKKFVEKAAIDFEQEIHKACRSSIEEIRTRILSFNELATEWLDNIRANFSINYLERATHLVKIFNEYLLAQGLYEKPISEITTRDAQMFLNSFSSHKTNIKQTVKLIKDFPKGVSLRELDRDKILSRVQSYNLRHNNTSIIIDTAQRICDKYNLDINEYFISNKEKTYSVETIKGYRRMLRTVFNEAVRYEWIIRNPICKTKVGGGNGNVSLRPIAEKEVYSFKEAQEFLRALEEESDDMIHQKVRPMLMLLAGLRLGEVHGLKWSDIDFDNKIININRNRLYSSQVGYYEKEPKTLTSKRSIPMPSALYNFLIKYQEWFRTVDNGFDINKDKYYLASNIYREPAGNGHTEVWLKRFEQKHGLKEVTCHGLRHTYCSLLLSQNVPIQTVSKYMGHSDSTITLKVYSHFIPDTQEKALNALNNLMENG